MAQAKLYLLAALLAKDGVISQNGKAVMKELILARDPELVRLLERFEDSETSSSDASLVNSINCLLESKAFEMLSDLYAECPLEVAKSLSKADRQGNDNKSLVYGEVDFSSFARVVRKLKKKRFYDLGSGSGRAVFAARLLGDFDECTGIEILDRLHDAAETIRRAYDKKTRALVVNDRVRFVKGSFLDYDWSDADLVFANSTCFEDDLMDQLARRAENLEPGAVVITFTKGLPDDTSTFHVVHRKRYKMSWGPATVFVHVRANDDGTLPDGDFDFDADDDDEEEDEEDEEDDALLTRDRELELALDREADEKQLKNSHDDFKHLQALVRDLD
ncbi:hypothetical protein CTAYLR_000675 [Chrysophaeum taylorii]|uniref:Histone-lysine N-methyltransferase, H3 lysine-79 specific n=1 Tax=Chrysophaeum taylorii TaxID=2483200 RepID=A0AAD7UAV7_9STRA|nr:hypothetical protein CTAYLR_000675 [Chrysophaeum taylorii]